MKTSIVKKKTDISHKPIGQFEETRFEKIHNVIFSDSNEASIRVAEEIAELIRKKQNQNRTCVLGLATGSSPIRVYEELVRMHNEEGLSFQNVVTFNLDEYLPMEKSNIQSYHYFMHEHLFNHIDIDPENVHIPDGTVSPDETVAYCIDYEKKIKDFGGLDFQLLGIGRTGHIGFNEPGNPFESRTHVVKLHRETREVNARFFDSLEEVPEYSMTMGIKTIMRSKRILLLATGEKKCEAIRKTLYGPITPDFPASVLQLHPDCRILVDKAAGQLLEMNSGTMAV